MAKTAPGEVKAKLPPSPPQQPESFDAIVGDLDRIVMPGITSWQHPRFFGYFPSSGALSSVLGDYVSTGLGVIGLAWQSSPALTEVEEVDDRLAAADARAVRAVERRDQRHRVDEHARRVDVCARARRRTTALAAAGCRRNRRPAGGLHVGAQSQLGGEGGAAGRLRQGQRADRAARRRATRCVPNRSSR